MTNFMGDLEVASQGMHGLTSSRSHAVRAAQSPWLPFQPEKPVQITGKPGNAELILEGMGTDVAEMSSNPIRRPADHASISRSRRFPHRQGRMPPSSPRIVDGELAELLEAAGAVVIEAAKACGKTLMPAPIPTPPPWAGHLVD